MKSAAKCWPRDWRPDARSCTGFWTPAAPRLSACAAGRRLKRVGVLRLRHAVAGVSGSRQSRLRPRPTLPRPSAQSAGTRHAPVLPRGGLRRTGRVAPQAHAHWTAAVSLATKPVGKPDAGNPHVRFDERGGETERLAQPQATAPFLDSTTIWRAEVTSKIVSTVMISMDRLGRDAARRQRTVLRGRNSRCSRAPRRRVLPVEVDSTQRVVD